MTRKKLYELLKITTGGLVGVVSHHYGSKLLDRVDILQEAKDKELEINNIKNTLGNLQETVQGLNSKLEQSLEKLGGSENVIIPKEVCEKIQSHMNNGVETLNKYSNDSSVSKDVIDGINQGINEVKQVSALLEKFTKGDVEKFLPDFLSIQDFYDFLNSLTLLEESALLHILIFIFLLLCVVNIISIFFGNEIIRYFDLEVKFPKLSFFFKLRSKFQRYYLAWTGLSMVVVCILGIGLNILVLC